MTSSAQGFSQGVGRWTGCAEVFDGRGRFLGPGRDRRTVGRAEDGKVCIEVSFEGPFSLCGHYDVDDRGDHRVYRGPANYGFAEALAPNLVDAHGYWPDAGLSQRFFMMVLPGGKKQLSLALMSRGEQLLYVVVGENDRSAESRGRDGSPEGEVPPEPAAGHGGVLLHRPGRWRGALRALGRDGEFPYFEEIEPAAEGLRARRSGGVHAPDPVEMELRVDRSMVWSGPGELAGSYSLIGGRASTGTFHHMSRELRLWRREVATRDGTCKAVLHLWFRGQERIGAEWGALSFEPR